jgi:hypothetical protein
MKRYILISALLVRVHANGQDTVLFNQINEIVAKVDLMASQGKFDTLQSDCVHWDGTTHKRFILKQGRQVQKITGGEEKIVFHNGKPVFRQMVGPSSTWTYYVAGENSYLYFKEDNRLITLDNKFLYTVIDDYLRPFKEHVDNDSN